MFEIKRLTQREFEELVKTYDLVLIREEEQNFTYLIKDEECEVGSSKCTRFLEFNGITHTYKSWYV